MVAVSEKRGELDKDLKLLHVFEDILNSNSPIMAIRMKFINILRDTSSLKTSLSPDEINWMVHNLDCIENIMRSKKAKTVMWCLYRKKETYIQEIARCCRDYTPPIRYWINFFKNLWLLEERQASFNKQRVYYHLNYKTYPNIIKAFLEIITKTHTEEYLDSLIKPNRRNDNTIVDLQYESVIRAKRVNRKF